MRVLCIVGAVVCSQLVNGYYSGATKPAPAPAPKYSRFYSGATKPAPAPAPKFSTATDKKGTKYAARNNYFDDAYYYDDEYDADYYDYAYDMYEEAAENLQRAQEEFAIAQEILDSQYFDEEGGDKKTTKYSGASDKKTKYSGATDKKITPKYGYYSTGKDKKTAPARNQYFDDYYYEMGGGAAVTGSPAGGAAGAAAAAQAKKLSAVNLARLKAACAGDASKLTPELKAKCAKLGKSNPARNQYFDEYYYEAMGGDTATKSVPTKKNSGTKSTPGTKYSGGGSTKKYSGVGGRPGGP